MTTHKMKTVLIIIIFLFLILTPSTNAPSQQAVVKIGLRVEVERILDIFAKEELGNRLSQFAMISLKQMILEIIDKYEKQAEKKEQKGAADE